MRIPQDQVAMKKVLIALLVIAVPVIAWLALRDDSAPAVEPPVRDDSTVRTTSAGDVVGFIHRHGVRAWLGIPFAAAPVGDLRWRAPQPPPPWAGVREALSAGSACPQKPSLLGVAESPGATLTGDEDCLYLNVWSPPGADNLPVMLWIHGGGNTIGRGDTYVASNLAAFGDVVVITINYRLGPFGWFAHPALASGDPLHDSGNYGTLDIVRALEWTRDNAAAFGGDPDNVTVFGESAGAFDTLAMMASPLARGLFHRAISQSGGFSPTPMSEALEPESEGGHPYSGPEIVNRLLAADGAAADRAAAAAVQSDMSAEEIRAYLYARTPAEIFALWEDGGLGMINVPDNFGDGHVLPAMTTAEIFGSLENHNPVPVILGTNRDEPSLFMARNPEFVKTFLWIFPRFRDEADYLRRVHYGGLAWKARGVDELAQLMTAAGNSEVFTYRFDWDEQGSIAGYDLSKALGAAHALELPFVFGDFEILPMAYLFDNSPGKEALSEAMMSYWSAFAHSGQPNRGRRNEQPQWLRWGTDGKTSIVLDTEAGGGIRMIDDLVTRQTVVQAIGTDGDIPSQAARCTLYLATFGWGGRYDRDEYANLGSGGCTEP
jgi:para-nitrobenzyl esterase